MRRPLPLLPGLLLVATACGPGAERPAPPARPAPESAARDREPSRVERARAALAPLKSRLMAALTEALGEGPGAAVAACRVEAPRIAAELSGDGLRVGRTSHRLRNPANAPAPWMRPLLQRYVEGEDAPHLTVELDGGALGYAEPIRTQPLCLDCHGTELPEPVRTQLAELYPQDRATGFAEGELRGLFWAVVPPAQ